MAINLILKEDGRDELLNEIKLFFEKAILLRDGTPLGFDSTVTTQVLQQDSSDTRGIPIPINWGSAAVVSGQEKSTITTINKPETGDALIFPIAKNRAYRGIQLLSGTTNDYKLRGTIDLGGNTATEISAYVLENIKITV